MVASASGIGPSEGLVGALASALASEEIMVAIVVAVNDEETELVARKVVQLDKLDSSSASSSALAKRVCSELEHDQAAYVLAKYASSDDLYLLVTHIPEACAVRKKMIYASTQGKLKLTVGLDNIARDVRTDSLEELEAELVQGTEDPLEEEASSAPPLTEEEAMLQRKNCSVHSKSNASYFEDRRALQQSTETKTTTCLAVDPAVASGAKDLGEGDVLRVVVSPESETLKPDGSDLPESAGTRTCFLIARRRHAAASPPLLLFLLCTGEATIRERMVFSIATQSLQDALRSAALDFESRAVDSAEEISEALGSADDGGSAEAKKASGFSRPKRPGRGKRGLVSKPAAA
ncbi:putative twinfilin [Chloropicon primus]|uniref:Putative twinfilin n=1 Tax=Chloropicon primus TaxID=1764295 RepID=A0A5B8MHU0_9CHLO|nr:putative twinfilin [Chloropicon primus]UPQ99408.1 putative twinfilin [Chloropicon primus]|eukprot:QDZ20198.1 putative twinfilin [Chloropicon primus]